MSNPSHKETLHAQTNVSAASQEKENGPRFQSQDADARREKSHQCPPQKGPQETHPLNSTAHPYRFSRLERITRDKEIARVLNDGARGVNGPLSVAWLARTGPHPGPRRLAIRVPRELDEAVGRNRVRRLLREIFRHEKFNLRSGTDLVVRVQPSPRRGRTALADLRNAFRAACREAGLWEGRDARDLQ